MRMVMPDDEIRMEYRQAKNKAGQIRILADENVCTVKRMKEYLLGLGLDVPRINISSENKTYRWGAIDRELFFKLYDKGLNDKEIAEQMKISVYRVRISVVGKNCHPGIT